MSSPLLRHDKTRQYDSQFDLVNHMILDVSQRVRSGRGASGVNLATEVVEEWVGGRTVTQMERRLEEVIESADWEEEDEELDQVKEKETKKSKKKA